MFIFFSKNFIYFSQSCCFVCIVCAIITFVSWLSFKSHYRVARLVVKNTEIVVKKQCCLFFHYIHAPFIQEEAIFKLRFCMEIEWTFWTKWSNLPNGALSKQHIILPVSYWKWAIVFHWIWYLPYKPNRNTGIFSTKFDI